MCGASTLLQSVSAPCTGGLCLADVRIVAAQVTPLQQCEASSLNVDCFNCDVAWLASGSCMPGVYAYQYTLTNSDGYSAVPVNVTVQIYEQVTPGTCHVLSLD